MVDVLTFRSTHGPQLSVGLLRLRFCPLERLPSPLADVGAVLDLSSLSQLRVVEASNGEDVDGEVLGCMLSFIRSYLLAPKEWISRAGIAEGCWK